MRESDWKTFRKRVPAWRERYLERINRELMELLRQEETTPTECFWDTHTEIREQARILQDCFDGHSRSKQRWYMMLMYNYGVINRADLEEFSSECLAEMERAVGPWDEPANE